MTRLRRLLAATTALAAALAGQFVAAVPAHAGTPAFTFHAPDPAGHVFTTEGFTFDVTVAMTENNGNLIDDIVATFSSPERTPETGELRHPTNNARSARMTQAVSFRWNGTYTANVTARGRSSFLDNDTSPRTAQRSFAVDANPKAPTGVKTAVDSKTRVVTISWAANTEPDLAGYVVEKQGSGGRWSELAATTKTSVTDPSTADTGGTHTYRVRALRRSASADRLNQSDATSTSAKVPAPPVTTTTAPAGGIDGGEDGEDGETDGGETGRGEGTGTQTGSTGGGTTTRGGSGSSGGSGPRLATSGKVSLSDFQALLADADRQGRGGLGGGPGEDDGTYDPTLPFGGRARGGDGEAQGDDGNGDDDGAVIELGEERTANEYSLALLAGGLLATVLAMIVLWVRSEVNRAEKLEPLTPEDRAPVSPEARFGFRDLTGAEADAAAPEEPPAPSARTRRRRPSPVAH